MTRKELDFTDIDSFEFDDHLVLLQKNASRVQVLNPLASIIWQLKKSGLSNLQIAKEISKVSNSSIDTIIQEIIVLDSQLEHDLSIPLDDELVKKEVVSFDKDLSGWKAENSIFFSFSRCTVQVNTDSQIIAEKVLRLFPFIQVFDVALADIQLDIIFNENMYLLVHEGLVLEQIETEKYTARMVFHHIVDLVCKYDDWLLILHASGVSWQGNGIIFPALGGSGKTTLTAALIKHDFGYINDDVIPLMRNTGELLHLSTCLSIKSGSWSLLQSFYPELEMLEIYGSQETKVKYLPPPHPADKIISIQYAKYIILPNYQAGAATELESISPVLALQAIIEGESLLRLPLKKKDIADLIKWLLTLTCYRLTYDKLDSAVTCLRQFCMDNK